MGCVPSALRSHPRQIELALLGGGECGKTTIFKQIQIIHGVGFGAEATAWIGAVHACPLRAVKTLLAAVSAKGLRLLPENESRRDALLASMQPAFMESYRLNVETVRAIQAVMMDPSVKKLLEAPYDLNLEDNALYFLDILDELVAPDYAPTTEHILKLRDPTRTIHTRHFRVGKAQLRVMDVGGQRCERPKWNLAEDITAVIFVCALTEYNQVLREDIRQNRLKESLTLFDIACNRRYPDKPILLILNKDDLFREKIKHVDLRCCFPEYTGGHDYERALDCIKLKFLNMRADKSKEIYTMVTTATDTRNMEFIISSVVEILQQTDMAASGLGRSSKMAKYSSTNHGSHSDASSSGSHLISGN